MIPIQTGIAAVKDAFAGRGKNVGIGREGHAKHSADVRRDRRLFPRGTAVGRDQNSRVRSRNHQFMIGTDRDKVLLAEHRTAGPDLTLIRTREHAGRSRRQPSVGSNLDIVHASIER